MPSSRITCRALFAAACAAGVAWLSPTACAEVIRELDPAGQVRVVREVAEDAAGNCVNHGVWQLQGPDGALAAEGQYKMGRRSGAWRRWITAAEAPPELASLAEGFEYPLLSRATFNDDQITGAWTIVDLRGRRLLSMDLVRGVRHGELRRWRAAGQLSHVENYVDGKLDGRVMTWAEAEHQLVHAATWVGGYRLVGAVSYHDDPAKSKASEGAYLLGPHVLTAPDDFWTSRLAKSTHGDKCLPHGLWRQWRPGGQLAAEGRYHWGRPAGKFTWRHANGQKAVQGEYDAAGQPAGAWRWWDAGGTQIAARRAPETSAAPGAPRVASRPDAAEPSAVR